MEDISAGEVNRYIYCSYQWYYTRIHGDKELRALYRSLNPGGVENRAFSRGRDFHENFGKHERLKRIALICLKAVVIIAAAFAASWFLCYEN